MNWADYAILIVLGLSALISIWRGFMREVLSLVGWVAAFWVALTFNGVVADALTSQIDTPSVRHASAYVILFVVTLLVAGIVNFLIGKLISSTGLTGTDRMLGVLFGVARGIAIVTVLIFGAGLTHVPEDPWWRQSMFVGHFQSLAVQIRAKLPDNVARHFTFPSMTGKASTAAQEILVPPIEGLGE